MKNFLNKIRVGRYEYVYLLMIILFAGMSTKMTEGLVTFSGSLLGLVIPPIMTIVLLNKHHVKFSNKNFIVALFIMTLWFIAQFIYRNGQINITLTLFHYYQLLLCFIVIQVFRENLFYVYEDIVYKLTVLGLILWLFSIIMPNILASIFRLFRNGTSISEGSALVYVMMKLSKVRGLIRNSGFAWEPGRYACFLCLAIFCNLIIHGYNIKSNRRLWVFFVALLTTQSTTGIFTLLVLAILFVFNRNVRHRPLYIILLVPVAAMMLSLDFAGDKLNKSMKRIERARNMDYYEEQMSLDRMESLVVEWNNFLHDPIMGYCEMRHSYFEKQLGSELYANNGTLQVISKYGLLGLLYYICIYISSKRIAKLFKDKVPIAYLLLFVSISMAYNFEQIVLIMAFSFWGIFVPPFTLQVENIPKECNK